MSKWVNDFWLVGAYTEILNITFPKCVWFYSITSNEYHQMAGIVKSFPGWGWISVWDITSVAWRWTLYVPSLLIFLYSRLLKCIYMQWLITLRWSGKFSQEKWTLNGQNLVMNLIFSHRRLLDFMLVLVYHNCSCYHQGLVKSSSSGDFWWVG